MDIQQVLRQALTAIDDSTAFDYQKVLGGDINDAYYIKSEQQTYFAKVNYNLPPLISLKEITAPMGGFWWSGLKVSRQMKRL